MKKTILALLLVSPCLYAQELVVRLANGIYPPMALNYIISTNAQADAPLAGVLPSDKPVFIHLITADTKTPAQAYVTVTHPETNTTAYIAKVSSRVNTSTHYKEVFINKDEQYCVNYSDLQPLPDGRGSNFYADIDHGQFCH